MKGVRMIEYLEDYIELMRLKHCIKNLLILFPLFFSGRFFEISKLQNAALGFIEYSALDVPPVR